ncbi:hypothetical protein, partial [uncultured Oscillibacter sp.]|uniref:hypothetical protein n=1 Tax=uncultured Oscillibacter sp. TaxID=876091 RepID=UPI0026109EED
LYLCLFAWLLPALISASLETLETSGMEHRPNTYDKPGTASGESGSICFLWFSPKFSQTFGEMTYNFMENWHKLTKRTLLTRKIF